jgi:hypothetical protein
VNANYRAQQHPERGGPPALFPGGRPRPARRVDYPAGRAEPLQVQQDYPGLEIAFTDAAGRHWVRRVTGELIESPVNVLDRYGISTPVDYTQLITGHN